VWADAESLKKLIESVCYDVLKSACDGWEINDGSYGEFTFDVEKRKVTLDFNERISGKQPHRIPVLAMTWNNEHMTRLFHIIKNRWEEIDTYSFEAWLKEIGIESVRTGR
jgi:hypothetical protein